MAAPVETAGTPGFSAVGQWRPCRNFPSKVRLNYFLRVWLKNKNRNPVDLQTVFNRDPDCDEKIPGPAAYS